MAERRDMPLGYGDGGLVDEELSKKFPSNAKAKKDISTKIVKQVTTHKVVQKKKGVLHKIADSFIGEEVDNVGGYILYDVLVPALKSMISDMVTGGIEMMLFGNKKGARTVREGGKTFVRYGGYRGPDEIGRPRTLSPVSRARHDFDDIILSSRGEAEEVLSNLVDFTVDYGAATVADLYSLVGISTSFTDNKYGWTDLSGAYIERHKRSGYLIRLPRTQELD